MTGASRGIGAATAKLLAEQGYRVVINYHKNQPAAELVVKQIKSAGGQALAIQADVADEASVIAMFDEVNSTWGRVSALVNNAGQLQTQSRLVNLSAERINHILKTNVTSQFLCCREAIKHMSNKLGGKGGAIVNVSSAASRIGAANEYIDYAASKGAIDTLTIGLSNEIAAEGIRVNCVRPGFIDTEMHADGGEANRIERVKHNIPLGRGGTAKEVAQAIAWLLSNDASYVTGTFVDIAGGR